MGRRIFAENNYNVTKRVVSYENFRPYINLEGGFKINPDHNERLIKKAEAFLGKEYPALLATDYMMFRRTGNRNIFEGKYFPRRSDLLALATAEHVEKKGRFTDSIINLVWMLLEESTWVLPAHNQVRPGGDGLLTYAFKEEVDYIDLFAATTAAALATVFFLCKEELEKEAPLLVERMHYELDRRIIKPFLNPIYQSALMSWTGVNGNGVNNWCPWIVSNILTVCAFTVKDSKTREVIVRSCLPMLDNFTAVYHSDGGCDEGPGYWDVAGGAYFNAALVLYDITNGYINVFKEDLVKKMGEYVVKAVITGDYVLNYADCGSKAPPRPIIIYQWGMLCDSEMMRTYGQSRLKGEPCHSVIQHQVPYRSLRGLCIPTLKKGEFIAPESFWFDGIKVAGMRETSESDKGLFVSLKGGHNAESHNHLDVGTIILFADGKPIFLDAGSGTYTRKTFSSERYTIWAMKSQYHNVATINGIGQAGGKLACSSDEAFDEENGSLMLNLKNAYKPEAGIDSYTRSVKLKDATVTLSDELSLENEGDVMFSFITAAVPSNVTEAGFEINGRTVSFDPMLRYDIEALDKTEPEVCEIPKRWDTDFLYRITLTNKEKFKSHKFVLTVK